MTKEYKKDRKKPVSLTATEKWTVAVYCIENKCVSADEHGKFTKFRMFMKNIREEVLTLTGKEVNDYHVRDSLAFFHEVNDFIKLIPNIPAQDSVQEDMLKIEVTKLKVENANLQNKINMLEGICANMIVSMETLGRKTLEEMRTYNALKTKG